MRDTAMPSSPVRVRDDDLAAILAAMSLTPGSKLRVRSQTTIEVLPPSPGSPRAASARAVALEDGHEEVPVPSKTFGEDIGGPAWIRQGARSWTVRSPSHSGQTSSVWLVQSAMRRASGGKPTSGAFYVVVRGCMPGVYDCWSAALFALQKDPQSGRHTQASVVVAVAGEKLAEDMFAYADDQGYVVQLPRLL